MKETDLNPKDFTYTYSEKDCVVLYKGNVVWGLQKRFEKNSPETKRDFKNAAESTIAEALKGRISKNVEVNISIIEGLLKPMPPERLKELLEKDNIIQVVLRDKQRSKATQQILEIESKGKGQVQVRYLDYGARRVMDYKEAEGLLKKWKKVYYRKR